MSKLQRLIFDCVFIIDMYYIISLNILDIEKTSNNYIIVA